MIYSFFRFILIFCAVSFVAVASVQAQDASNSGARPSAEQEDLPKGIKESLVKNRIDREKKDFQEMLERADEAAKLSDELDKSFVKNNALTVEDKRKLERLEKISKKIREELGGSSDSEADDKTAVFDGFKLSSTSDAVDKLKSISAKLSEELKKTSRYTISALSIQSSNTILKIVRFIRTGKN